MMVGVVLVMILMLLLLMLMMVVMMICAHTHVYMSGCALTHSGSQIYLGVP